VLFLCVVDLHVCECFYHLLRSMHYRIKFSNNCIKSTLSKGVETILLGLRIKSSFYYRTPSQSCNEANYVLLRPL